MPQINMIRYIIRRLLIMLPTIFGVLIFTFIMPRMLSGDPIMMMFPIDVDPIIKEAAIRELGLDRPWYTQLLIYLRNFFMGDWGDSLVGRARGIPVLEWMSWMIPRTIQLTFIPMVAIPFIGVKLGVISAQKKDKPIDTFIRGISVAGMAFPVFWTGMIFRVFSGVTLQDFTNSEFWFPTFGFKDIAIGDPPKITKFRIIDCIISNEQILLWDSLEHLVLPVICIMWVSLAGISRMTRSSMLDVLDQDYIRTARAKGCLEDTVVNKHALRNALIPTSNIIIGSITGSLTGSMILEVTFNLYGLGQTMFDAIMFRDYFMINGIALFIAIIILLGNLMADIMYTIIDPRIIY
ncbi:MAG: ABC transporter permease [Promethearchaeota archaeon]